MTSSDIGFLRPGCIAPWLDLDQILTSGRSGQLLFDRRTVLVLWNAGCAGCIETINHIANIAVQFGANCYAVAVYVRDVEATVEAAKAIDPKAVVAIERCSAEARASLGRGSVARAWLEPSGIGGVPSAFLVDARRTVLWLGEAVDATAILTRAAGGQHNVEAARKEVEQHISEYEIRKNIAIVSITEATLERNIQRVMELIEEVEARFPQILHDTRYANSKSIALSRMGAAKSV